MASNTEQLKTDLVAKAENLSLDNKSPKLTKNMTMDELIRAMAPEIKKALPEVITPERFTRMALSALNTTPKLRECTQLSVLAALMQAAQLGLEPNTALGEAYLIPYNNKGTLECQFQIGYKGLISLAYRNPQMQIVTAQEVYENDKFEYELGLTPKLVHVPALEDRGEIRLFYGLFKLHNGGYSFEIMSREAMDSFAKENSKGYDSKFSPWQVHYIEMGKKTVIKKVLKYAPMITDIRRAFTTDESIKKELSQDMTEVRSLDYYDMEK